MKRRRFSEGPIRLGAICDVLGVSRSTLHAWEARGLIVSTRDKSNNRLYAVGEARKVHLIARYRAWGFDLAEICDVFSANANPVDVQTATAFRKILREVVAQKPKA